MIIDTSFTTKLRCDNCKRKTEHYGLLSPEGEIVFLECTNCGSLKSNGYEDHRQKQLAPRLAVAVAGIAILALATMALFGGWLPSASFQAQPSAVPSAGEGGGAQSATIL
ncbi:MAG TPA: hypothetical protein VFF30_15180 [Nitrososphaerales archaeon]|nr:hypothetical protein [Nitrososphaerales archaeon]